MASKTCAGITFASTDPDLSLTVVGSGLRNTKYRGPISEQRSFLYNKMAVRWGAQQKVSQVKNRVKDLPEKVMA
jgi:hypothetical protein